MLILLDGGVGDDLMMTIMLILTNLMLIMTVVYADDDFLFLALACPIFICSSVTATFPQSHPIGPKSVAPLSEICSSSVRNLLILFDVL